MLQKPKCPIIALEEHYWDRELAEHFTGIEAGRDPEGMKRLFDLGELRLKEMDEAGIDMQVISHGAPALQKLPADSAVELGRRVNDRLRRGDQGAPEALRRLRRAADRRSQGRRRRAGAGGHASSASRAR